MKDELEYLFFDSNDDLMYSESKSISCRHCEWSGTMKETKGRYVHTPPSSWRSLAGREGYEYDCPKCGFTVSHHYTRIS